jgi:hypothetical protein
MIFSDLNELIQQKNPFAGHTVVRPPQIWRKSFPDVPSIHSHASNTVLDAVQQIRQGHRQTIGITIRGEKGLGKTQVISRIRHGLQARSEALFVYVGKHDNLDKINYQFLQNVSSSLRVFGSIEDVMQWQELATLLINEARNCSYTPQQYIEGFPGLLQKYSNQVVDKMTERVVQAKPEISDPYLIKAILWTLSSAHKTYAAYWLSGLELTEKQAEIMGLPNRTRAQQEREALTTAREILNIVSYYRIPVICFDELDGTDANEHGWTAAQLSANLAKDLYNNLKSGVLVLSMYEETWRDQIRALPQAEAVIDRIASYPKQREPIDLKYLNAEEVIAVASQWLKEFYEEHQQTPPYPVYPFDENQLRNLGQQGRPTVRAVLKWCAENFAPTPENGNNQPEINPVKAAFESELQNLEESIDSFMEDSNRVAKALFLAFSTLKQQTIEGVTVNEIEETASAADKGYIHFKIVGRENEQVVKIGVAVLQHSGGRYQGAALKRLIDYDKFDLTRGCLVRSKKINFTASKAQEYINTLLKEKGGEWVLLQSQDIKPLLAILSVSENCSSYELDEKKIMDFIQQENLASRNPLVREILSDPSGQEPENLFDEDIAISVPQSESNSTNDLDLDRVANN